MHGSRESLVSRLFGRHLVVDLFGCDSARLDDVDYLRGQTVAAAEAMEATVVAVHAHRFEPHGVSVFVVLAESHLAIHTWPEYSTASLDIFVCCPDTDPHRAKSHLSDCLRSTHSAELELHRGSVDHIRSSRVRELEALVQDRSPKNEPALQ